MSKTIGRNVNKTDVGGDKSPVTLNSSTATKILDANDDRISYTISNPNSQDVWIKEQAATVDNLKQGKILFKRSVYESPTDNIYTGEVSAISVSGSPSVFPGEL